MRTVLRTPTQVFDVEIEDRFNRVEITVRVGSDRPDDPFGHQGLVLIVRHDANLGQILRDWRDLMELLPTAIMEAHL